MKTSKMLIIPKTCSKKQRKEILKQHRKPAMPKPRISESKAEFLEKQKRVAKQRGYTD